MWSPHYRKGFEVGGAKLSHVEGSSLSSAYSMYHVSVMESSSLVFPSSWSNDSNQRLSSDKAREDACACFLCSYYFHTCCQLPKTKEMMKLQLLEKKHLLDHTESNSSGNKKKGSDLPSPERNLGLTNE